MVTLMIINRKWKLDFVITMWFDTFESAFIEDACIWIEIVGVYTRVRVSKLFC